MFAETTIFFIHDILREKITIICNFLVRVNFNQIFPTEENWLAVKYDI